MRQLAAALLALVVIVATARLALAQQTTITGIVTDQHGAPLGDVTVEAYRDGLLVASTLSGSNGYFSLPLSPGAITIVFYRRGYERKTIAMEVPSGRGIYNIGTVALGYAINTILDATYLKAKQGSELRIPLTLVNVGVYTEEVGVEVRSPPGWRASVVSEYGFAIRRAILTPRASKVYALSIHVPGGADGVKNITVQLSYADVRQNVTLTVEVEPGEWSFVQPLYPEVSAFAGTVLRVPVEIVNPLPRACTVNITVYPPRGWLAYLLVGGFQVNSLRLSARANASAEVFIQVPEGASPGKYSVNVISSAFDLTARTSIVVNVVSGYESLALDARVSVVNAYAGGQASIPVTILNTGTRAATVTFEVRGLPPGYEWHIKDEQGNFVISLRLPPQSAQRLVLTIDIPSAVAPSAISFVLIARSSNSSATAELGLNVLGKISLNVVTQNWEVEAASGSTSTFRLTIENDGQVSLKEVLVEVSTVPSGMSVRIDPPRVVDLPPRARADFTVTIAVEDRVLPGRYYVPLIVRGLGVRVERALVVNVRGGGAPLHILASLIMILLALAALVSRWIRVRRSNGG